MATLVNFSSLTAPNGAVERISELLFTSAWKLGELSNAVNLRLGQKNGGKLAFVDSIGAIAVKDRVCNPTYAAVTPKGYEKTWDMGDYQIPIKICAQDWRNTLAEYALHKGTSMDDMTDTEIVDKILMPLITRAYEEALWRIVWFADKNAALIANSGVITAGTNLDLLKITDGLWKRIAAIVTADATKKTTIAANAQTTYATQKSAIAVAGTAVGVVESMLADADGRIFNNGGKLMMTNLFFQALRKDYNNTYKQTIPFENVSRGVSISEFDGIQILVLNEWDLCIKTYENSGTAWNAPHRVLFANPSNLLVGTEDSKMMADLDLHFDKTDRQNYLYAASNIGTLVAEDDLIQVAY